MTTKAIYDYHESGFRVFPLWGIDARGKCACGDDRCEAVGKHPRISFWQLSPHWSDDQMEVMFEHQISTGFGVCLDNHLVIDIDARNGGWESYERLKNDLGVDFESASDFVVTTGGGGLHIYFSRPECAYSGHLQDYKGIDFKSSGYLVGAGSLHKSGNRYEYKKGFPDESLAEAPSVLLEKLEKKAHTRAFLDGAAVDVTEEEVADIVSFIEEYDDYQEWVTVGMGIHHATKGAGYHIWDSWSQQSSKYDPSNMGVKWHSFGKSANPVTLGTLVYMAERHGYARPITFPSAPVEVYETVPGELPFDATGYDIKRPPGFVGKLADWMNGNSYSEPLERLTCISAICAVGNIIGLHTTDDVANCSTNLLVLCVAASASGKEMVGQSYSAILRAAGMAQCLAGGIKSKQEIGRNLIEHQAVFYLIDEMGEVLKSIENAKKRGGAAYLEGVTGEVMSIYTKASSCYQVTGDVRRDLVAILERELAAVNSQLDRNEDIARNESKRDRIQNTIHQIKTSGLFRPYLSMIGYSVPGSMECIMTPEMVLNGFLSRALLAIELKENPKPVPGANGMRPLPDSYANTLRSLASTGSFDLTDHSARVEYLGERRKIQSTPEAKALLERLRMWEWEFAEFHRETSGFTPVIRRSFELICKISTILAAPEGVRTVEHVKWASVFVKADIVQKIREVSFVASKASKDETIVRDGIAGKILNLCDKEGGERATIIYQKVKRKDVSREAVQALIDDLVAEGALERHEGEAGKNGQTLAPRYETV